MHVSQTFLIHYLPSLPPFPRLHPTPTPSLYVYTSGWWVVEGRGEVRGRFGNYSLKSYCFSVFSLRVVNPFTAPACTFSGYKSAHIHACKQYVFSGPIINPLPVLCISIEVLSRAHAERGKRLNDFRKVGRFGGGLFD